MSTVDESLQAQIRTIERQYGKPLGEWIALIKESGLTKHTSNLIRSIIQDFQAHDLPLDQLQYGVSINDFVGKDYPTVITLNSSASFIDPRGCNGPCDIGSVWLGVYNSSIDAQSEYKGLVNYEAYQAQTPGPGPGALASIVQVGRSILIGESDTSDYATILRNDCT